MASKFKLLNIDANAKTVKGQARGYLTGILYLSPSDASGTQLCPLSHVAKCAAPCLNLAGRGGMAKGNATFISPGGHELSDNTVQRARLRRTELFLEDYDAFMALLVKEIRMAERMAQEQGLTLALRLNGTSDIRWEDFPVEVDGRGYYNIFRAFPHIQFYDYTKIPNRRRALIIPNYHLTYSYSGVSDFAPVVIQALRTYGERVNMAVVFRGDVPKTFLGRQVINGDESDLRFLDPTGVVIALKAKGKAQKDTSGFVVDHINSPALSVAA
jgi:hypothetical protein